MRLPTRSSPGRGGRGVTALLIAALAVSVSAGCGGGSRDTGTPVPEVSASTPADQGGAGGEAATPGVYKFGQTVKFADGSTLTVGKPVKFTPDEYAVTGDRKPLYLKFRATFRNNTQAVFDPTLTSASASAAGEEGESVYQDGLGTPDNKVLPGRSVSWWMGYGVKGRGDLQLEITMGLTDYGTVIFTD